jgi:protein-disulfide reductase (glutathione)
MEEGISFAFILDSDLCSLPKSSVVEELAKNFIMVNLEDSEEPADKQYAQDGGYIPRIYYVDSSNGEVRGDIFNENGHAQYKYFYGDVASVAAGMKQAIVKLTK